MHFTYLIVFYFQFITIHPFHVSVCDIELNKEDQTLEITQKFFVDDLEEALNRKFSVSLDLLGDSDHEELDGYLRKYLSEKLKLYGNDRMLVLNFLGSEIEEDAIHCYLEVQDVAGIESLEVHSSALLEVFDDQQNLVHVRIGSEVKSILLTHSEPGGKIIFRH